MTPRTLVRVQPPELDAEARALHALSDTEFISLMRKARHRPAPEPDGATLAEVFAREADALNGRCFALTVANAHEALTRPPALHIHVLDAPHALRLHVAPSFEAEFARLVGAHRRVRMPDDAHAIVVPSPYDAEEHILAHPEAPPKQHEAARVWWSASLGDDDRIFVAGLTAREVTPRSAREWNALRAAPLIVSPLGGWSMGQFECASRDEEPRGTSRARYVPRVLVADGITVVETPWGALTARDAVGAHAVRECVIERCTFAYEVPVT